jgi:hypothetical protein
LLTHPLFGRELLTEGHNRRHQQINIDLLALLASNSYPPLLLRHVRPNASKLCLSEPKLWFRRLSL